MAPNKEMRRENREVTATVDSILHRRFDLSIGSWGGHRGYLCLVEEGLDKKVLWWHDNCSPELGGCGGFAPHRDRPFHRRLHLTTSSPRFLSVLLETSLSNNLVKVVPTVLNAQEVSWQHGGL
uniref:Uncharacterized protein n=1 Tax=Zea mays TaxID=4577 RepID=B6U8K0_MAIZE|nr:hypothetical protein [Zea mays]